MKSSADACDRPFDAVLCDIDGVIRFYDTDVVCQLEKRVGLLAGTTAAIGFAPENDLPLLLGQITREQWAHSIVQGLVPAVARAEAQMLAKAFTEAESRIDDAVVRLLRRVRSGCPVVLVSNATVWLDEDLELLGLRDLADDVVNSSLVGVAKPDRRIYEIAAERAGVPTDRCLFVDDREENTTAAAELGMTTVLYRDAAGLEEALAPVLRSSLLT
ncbi:HAD-IA family hydrolase [Isoptericola sp. S6320L]|uniref:HAD-IA family hydrolase n=1 Tax=Isoptericola sp. S6320L TaxID=2926411 RepID=UPI001FF6AEDC|nr:HAD-IA family hydrolase [Isoptericola sp. S6320L]MCK0115985.1 HAD-IA family hydrolase [Isoptericola sp. S6320L]